MRLQLTRRADYAIRACLHLAAQDQCPISGRVIAEQMAIPDRFLPQVMADLGRAGIVRAVNGKHGGYCLRRDPGSLSVLDLVEAVEGSGAGDGGAVRGTPVDGMLADSLLPVWAEAQAAFIDVLARASISQLAARERAAEADIGPGSPERTRR